MTSEEPKTCAVVKACGATCRYRARHVVRSPDGADVPVCGVHARADRMNRDRRGRPECYVCLEPVPLRPARMSCGHEFCPKCIGPWFSKNALTCPACRAVCWEGVTLVGRRMVPKLRALMRTRPRSPNTFYPAYVLSLIDTPAVTEALSAGKSGGVSHDVLRDVVCSCFTERRLFDTLKELGL